MLKSVEIVIIINIRGIKRENFRMKQQVLKTLANPAQIFHVPYSLAVLNFAAQFIVFIIIFTIALTIGTDVNPMWFLLSVITVHSILAMFSRRDPQLGQILSAKIQLMKQKIPSKLAA